MHVFITANSPGEIAGWVKPLAIRLKEKNPRVKVSLVICPCQYASGREIMVAREWPWIDEIVDPRALLKYVLLGRQTFSWNFEEKSCILFLGGDPFYAAILSRRMKIPAFAYTERPGWEKYFKKFLVSNSKAKEKLIHSGVESKKIEVVGYLALDSIDLDQKEEDIYDELDAILIDRDSDFSKMSEPLVFWAYDDTVEPGKSYQYQIRLGVFNPIAGTDQFSEEYKSFENKVVLWSTFSDITESVTIPEKLYFFPLAVQEAVNAVNTVKIAVARYVLGYWYSEEFMVERGEVIGKVVKTEIEEKDEDEMDSSEEGVTIPETIDYSTGAVFVDVRGPVTDWLGGRNMRPRQYYDMLYSYDGVNIEHKPIESRYWAKDLLVKFNEVGRSEKETKVALRPWGSRAGGRGRISPLGPAGPAGPGGQDMADDYMRMMQEMMMQGMR